MFVAALSKEPKLGTTQTSFNGGMVSQTVVYPYYGILLSNRKKQTLDTHNTLDKRLEN